MLNIVSSCRERSSLKMALEDLCTEKWVRERCASLARYLEGLEYVHWCEHTGNDPRGLSSLWWPQANHWVGRLRDWYMPTRLFPASSYFWWASLQLLRCGLLHSQKSKAALANILVHAHHKYVVHGYEFNFRGENCSCFLRGGGCGLHVCHTNTVLE